MQKAECVDEELIAASTAASDECADKEPVTTAHDGCIETNKITAAVDTVQTSVRLGNIYAYLADKATYLKLLRMSLIGGAIIVLVIELLWRGTITETLTFMGSSITAYLVTILGVALVIMLGTFLLGRFTWSYGLCSLIFFMLGCANMYKYNIRGEVVTAAEFGLGWEATNIMGEFNVSPPFVAIFGFFVLLFALFLLKKSGKLHITVRQRILGVAVMLMLNSFMFATVRNQSVLAAFDMETIFMPEDICRKNGLLLSIEGGMPKKPDKPQGYSKEAVLSVLPNVSGITNGQKPNIIIVMNESFFNINDVEGLDLSKNPIPNFEEYTKNYPSGYIYTPVLGGGTCQTEYEVLTGYSTESTGGEIAYTRFVKGDFESIASMAKKNGYDTLAIHPYYKTFFMRNSAYPSLGFDRFITMEDMKDPEYENNFISDSYAYRRLIKEYEEKDGPLFTHIVTMQNHGGYWWGYNKHNVEVLNENMSYENMGAMQTYANLLKESDEALAEMISYFSKTEEPTYIVFFGDHLPAMGNVYEELSFVGAGSEKSNEDILNLHKTPFFIWSNTENVEAEDLGNINAYKLGAIVMEYAGVNTDPYFAYLSNMTVNGTKGLFETENGIKELEDLPEHMKKELSERWLIQYDRMFGKGYAAQP